MSDDHDTKAEFRHLLRAPFACVRFGNLSDLQNGRCMFHMVVYGFGKDALNEHPRRRPQVH